MSWILQPQLSCWGYSKQQNVVFLHFPAETCPKIVKIKLNRNAKSQDGYRRCSLSQSAVCFHKNINTDAPTSSCATPRGSSPASPHPLASCTLCLFIWQLPWRTLELKWPETWHLCCWLADWLADCLANLMIS